MIYVKNLHFSYEETKIFSGINLEILEHDAVVVLGPSGHGKSTLLKLIAGLSEPNSGSIEITQKKAMSMLFQKNALFDSMTNEENVSFPRHELQISSNNLQEARSYLKAVGLEDAASLYPDEISGGMQKRLGIARALAVEPEILLYDDPTAGLDPITSRDIAKLIRKKQKENNATIISVTNDMMRAYQLGEKFLFVYNEQVEFFPDRKALENSNHPAVYQFIRGLTKGPLSADDIRV